MEQSGYYRRYIILQELDPGFGVQRPPEGFARIDGSRDGLMLSLQIRNLREGTEPYSIILIYDKNNETGILRAGAMEIVTRNGYYSRRKLDYEAIQTMGMQPENLQFIIIASEHQERVSIPMIGICNKAYPWNESIRQRLLKKESPQPPQVPDRNTLPETKLVVKKDGLPEVRQVEKKMTPEAKRTALEKMEKGLKANEENPSDRTEHTESKVDDVRLERKLKDTFETIEPFSNPRHDYAWYRINDLARLSNLLFACNLRIPLFANPKILVGLFKYRHLLAGFYRSDRNDMNYFVLGVPSRDDTEGKPFEDISRWVASQNTEYGDMTGYWLVYISLRSGEFVR